MFVCWEKTAEIPLSFCRLMKGQLTQPFMVLVEQLHFCFYPKKTRAVLLLSSIHHSIEADENKIKQEIGGYYKKMKAGWLFL